MSFQSKHTKRDIALDGCGIGHNVEENFREGSSQIADLAAMVAKKCQDQITYNLLTNAPCSVEMESGPIKHALVNGLASACGKFCNWDIAAARNLAAMILQEVNDHKEAAKLFTLAANDPTTP